LTSNETVYNAPTSDAPTYNKPTYGEPTYNESTQSELTYSNPAQSDPAYSSQDYNNLPYSKPVYNSPLNREQTYNENAYADSAYKAPTYNAPVYSEPAYSKPVQNEPTYREPREALPWNMYSPGICVNQPFQRSRNGDALRSEAQRKRAKMLVGVLRTICIVLVCAMFSAAATYAVMDYRFKRGDFVITNQVVLGGNATTNNRQEGNLTAPVATASDEMSAQDIYDMARTQVVVINTEAPGFFGMPDSSNPVSGSGFIISSDGYILTNYHVIELAFENDLPISVVLNDGVSYDAEVVGFEKDNDVAVIKIDAEGLNAAVIGDSDNIRVGQTIYAIGNPFGDLVFTMTDGIVSAIDRVVSVEGKSIGTFQFSAAVNRGNSGGPIYNTDGEVLGIVTAKVVRGNVEGIGFAIPINDAIEIASDLIEFGYLQGRPLIGITGQTVSSGQADYNDLVVGILIRGVAPDSAAEIAGIIVGDIITALGGEEIDSMELLRFTLRDYRAGDTTTITVWRNGEYIDLTITFDEDMYAGQSHLRPPLDLDSLDPFENFPE